MPFPNNQSVLQPLQEGSTFMGFAQSDGLTGCYRFEPPPQISIPPLLGCVTKKRGGGGKSSSLITVVGEQVALLQRATTIGNTGWFAGRNVRQTIHGPVGHLSVADNGSRRHIFTDLWPPLRRTDSRVHTRRCSRTRARARLPYRLQLETLV